MRLWKIGAALALLALAVLAPRSADAREWESKAVVGVNLVALDFGEKAIGLDVSPMVGIGVTDGDWHFALGASLDLADVTGGARSFTPTLLAGYNWYTVGVGYRIAEPELRGQGWDTSLLLLAGPGTPVEQVESE